MDVYWLVGQTYHTSAALAAGSSATDNIPIYSVGGAEVHATAAFTFSTAPTIGEIVIDLLPCVDGTTTYSTIPISRIELHAAEIGTSIVQPFTTRAPNTRVKVTNGTNQPCSAYEGKYAYCY